MVQPINMQAGRIALQSDPAAIDTEKRLNKTSAVSATGDAVSLSPEARALPAALQAGPPIDAGRVTSLRTAIAEGSYKPDPERIANSLAQNIMELSY